MFYFSMLLPTKNLHYEKLTHYFKAYFGIGDNSFPHYRSTWRVGPLQRQEALGTARRERGGGGIAQVHGRRRLFGVVRMGERRR